jgi:hypothetical protein
MPWYAYLGGGIINAFSTILSYSKHDYILAIVFGVFTVIFSLVATHKFENRHA